MQPFPDTYEIPKGIKALVKGEEGASDFTDIMLRLAPNRARTRTDTYHLSFKTKLFLEEEESQSRIFDRYHINSIRIEHFNLDKFRFRIYVSVCLFFHFISLLKCSN